MKDPSHRLELAGRLALEKVEVVECERAPRARRPHSSCVVNTCDYYDGSVPPNENNVAFPGNIDQAPVVPARSGRVVTLASGGIFAVTGCPIRFYDIHGEYLYSLEEAGHIRGGRITLLHPKHVIATLNRDRRLMTWSINPGGSVQYLSSHRLNLNPHRSASLYRSTNAHSQYYGYRSPGAQFSYDQFSPFGHHVSHSHHPTEMISVGTSLLLVGDNLGNVHLISHNNGRSLRSINIQLNGIHIEKICYLASNHTDKFSVSSKDGIISVWSISKNNIIHCIGRLPTVWGTAYRIDMNDDYLVAAGNGELRIYDLNSASIGISKIITNAYSYDTDGNGNNNDNAGRSPILKIFGGQWIIVGGGGKTLSILNIHTAKVCASILTPFERVRALDFTRDNKLVVTSVDTGGLALLDLRIPRNVMRDLREWTKQKFSSSPSNEVPGNGKCTTHDETSDDENIDENHEGVDEAIEERTACGNHHDIDDDLHDDDNGNLDIESLHRRRRILQATSSIAIAALGCLLLKCGRRFLNRT